MEKILIVEDDKSMLLGLEKNLSYEGYEIISATDGEKGLQLAIDKTPDLMILDIMLPKINGFEICKILRKRGIKTPIIMLSAKSQEIDKIMGLDLGADDYITKPFSVRELLARINVLLRRHRESKKEITTYQFDDVRIDFKAQTLTKKGKPQEVSAKELALLKYLIENKNVALDRNTILNRVWGYNYFGTSRTIDNFVTRLRQKIEKDPENPKRLQTARGIGYKFVGD